MSLVHDFATLIDSGTGRRRQLVAVDGPDAAGKTSFARGLAEHCATPVITSSLDGWHNPREQRLRRGRLSAEGYYRDSFDYVALRRRLLEPFARGAPSVPLSIFDHSSDNQTTRPVEAPPQATLIVEGVFLLRPELRHQWHLALYLHVPESVTLERAMVRDLELFGSTSAVRKHYYARYLPGQALYRFEAHPVEHAHIVLDNSDCEHPTVLKWQPPISEGA